MCQRLEFRKVDRNPIETRADNGEYVSKINRLKLLFVVAEGLFINIANQNI